MKNALLVSTLAAAFAVVGCPSSSPSPSTTTNVPSSPEPTAAPTTTASSTATSAPTGAPTSTPASDPTGTWSSAACGERKYARTITIAADATFTAQDLVSPCPKDAKCVWSGIVDRKGTWKVQGKELSLSTDPNVKEKTPGSPFPKSLLWEDGALVEVAGADRCVYKRS